MRGLKKTDAEAKLFEQRTFGLAARQSDHSSTEKLGRTTLIQGLTVPPSPTVTALGWREPVVVGPWQRLAPSTSVINQIASLPDSHSRIHCRAALPHLARTLVSLIKSGTRAVSREPQLGLRRKNKNEKEEVKEARDTPDGSRAIAMASLSFGQGKAVSSGSSARFGLARSGTRGRSKSQIGEESVAGSGGEQGRGSTAMQSGALCLVQYTLRDELGHQQLRRIDYIRQHDGNASHR